MEPTDRLLKTSEVAKLLSLSRVTIFRLRRDGKFPEPLKMSQRCNRWRLSDIEEFMKSQNGTVDAA